MLSTSTCAPPTSDARARRSGIVVTTVSFACAGVASAAPVTVMAIVRIRFSMVIPFDPGSIGMGGVSADTDVELQSDRVVVLAPRTVIQMIVLEAKTRELRWQECQQRAL